MAGLGRIGGGVLVGLTSLWLALGLGGAAWVAFTDPFREGGAQGTASREPIWWLGILLSVGAAVVLVGGLWVAWRVSHGGWRGPAGGEPLPGRVWHVAEPGTDLLESPGGEVVMRLLPGAALLIGRRAEEFVRVLVIPEGQTGWVDRRALG